MFPLSLRIRFENGMLVMLPSACPAAVMLPAVGRHPVLDQPFTLVIWIP